MRGFGEGKVIQLKMTWDLYRLKMSIGQWYLRLLVLVKGGLDLDPIIVKTIFPWV